jgi:Fur family ferric uptake transcriptional regulator
MRIIIKKAPPEALRATGRRLTRARRVILECVQATDAHPSAAAVHRDVQRRLPRVSLATVYRNLRMLAAEGLLSERAALTGLRFDGNTAPHDHFTCVTCGRIYDVPARRARGGARLTLGRGNPRRVSPFPSGRAGFEVLSRRIEFYGRCLRCSHTRSKDGSKGTLRGCPSQRRKIWQGEASRAARASRT